jgi:hypothetical protein
MEGVGAEEEEEVVELDMGVGLDEDGGIEEMKVVPLTVGVSKGDTIEGSMDELDSITEVSVDEEDGDALGDRRGEEDGEGVELPAFWYRFKRFPAPQYSVLFPAQSMLQSVAGWMTLPVPSAAPQ